MSFDPNTACYFFKIENVALPPFSKNESHHNNDLSLSPHDAELLLVYSSLWIHAEVQRKRSWRSQTWLIKMHFRLKGCPILLYFAALFVSLFGQLYPSSTWYSVSRRWQPAAVIELLLSFLVLQSPL